MLTDETILMDCFDSLLSDFLLVCHPVEGARRNPTISRAWAATMMSKSLTRAVFSTGEEVITDHDVGVPGAVRGCCFQGRKCCFLDCNDDAPRLKNDSAPPRKISNSRIAIHVVLYSTVGSCSKLAPLPVPHSQPCGNRAGVQSLPGRSCSRSGCAASSLKSASVRPFAPIPSGHPFRVARAPVLRPAELTLGASARERVRPSPSARA